MEIFKIETAIVRLTPTDTFNLIQVLDMFMKNADDKEDAFYKTASKLACKLDALGLSQ